MISWWPLVLQVVSKLHQKHLARGHHRLLVVVLSQFDQQPPRAVERELPLNGPKEAPQGRSCSRRTHRHDKTDLEFLQWKTAPCYLLPDWQLTRLILAVLEYYNLTWRKQFSPGSIPFFPPLKPDESLWIRSTALQVRGRGDSEGAPLSSLKTY